MSYDILVVSLRTHLLSELCSTCYSHFNSIHSSILNLHFFPQKKEFSVIPPFVQVGRRSTISTRMTMIDNGFYNLRKPVSLRTEIMMKAVTCRNGFIVNPYNLPDCDQHLGQLCLTQRGLYGSTNPQVREFFEKPHKSISRVIC